MLIPWIVEIYSCTSKVALCVDLITIFIPACCTYLNFELLCISQCCVQIVRIRGANIWEPLAVRFFFFGSPWISSKFFCTLVILSSHCPVEIVYSHFLIVISYLWWLQLIKLWYDYKLWGPARGAPLSLRPLWGRLWPNIFYYK